MIPTDLILRRGDTRTITLTMDEGATLETSVVKFTTRTCAEAAAAVWEKTESDGITVSSDTVAAVSITEDDWTTWEAAGRPKEMAYDWEVRPQAGGVATPAHGTIRVIWDVTR